LLWCPDREFKKLNLLPQPGTWLARAEASSEAWNFSSDHFFHEYSGVFSILRRSADVLTTCRCRQLDSADEEDEESLANRDKFARLQEAVDVR
jgi:hypothetical protein